MLFLLNWPSCVSKAPLLFFIILIVQTKKGRTVNMAMYVSELNQQCYFSQDFNNPLLLQTMKMHCSIHIQECPTTGLHTSIQYIQSSKHSLEMEFPTTTGHQTSETSIIGGLF